QGRQGSSGELEVRGLSAERALQDRLEERRHDQAGRYGDHFRLAGQRRHELGPLPRSDVRRWQEDVLRAAGGERGRRKRACRQGAVMRQILLAALIVTAPMWSATISAQNAQRGTAASTVPRMSDGKPDLTGVWQGASSRRGSWEEANSGLGVGG